MKSQVKEQKNFDMEVEPEVEKKVVDLTLVDKPKEEEGKGVKVGEPPKETLEDIGKKYIGATDGTAVVQWDPYLEPYVDALRGRYGWYKELLRRIDQSEGGLVNFAHSYKRYGLNRCVDPATGKPGTLYREWAPHGIIIIIITYLPIYLSILIYYLFIILYIFILLFINFYIYLF